MQFNETLASGLEIAAFRHVCGYPRPGYLRIRQFTVEWREKRHISIRGMNEDHGIVAVELRAINGNCPVVFEGTGCSGPRLSEHWSRILGWIQQNIMPKFEPYGYLQTMWGDQECVRFTCHNTYGLQLFKEGRGRRSYNRVGMYEYLPGTKRAILQFWPNAGSNPLRLEATPWVFQNVFQRLLDYTRKIEQKIELDFARTSEIRRAEYQAKIAALPPEERPW